MKVLIFGSTGLVGNSLKKVLGDNNNFQLLTPSRKEVNLFNSKVVSNYIKKNNPNLIINAAAKVGGIHANNTYKTAFLTENLKINLNILESCIDFPNIKIINLGSSCIYPLNAKNPIKESSLMTGKLEPTNSPYALAKITSIELGNALSSEYGHNIINLMPTNLYGPNDSFDPLNSHVIPGMIYRMHQGKKSKSFKIWGTGKPKREFLYSIDLAKSIEFIIENNINESLINIGSGVEISTLNLAKKIGSVVGFQGEFTFDKSKPDGNPRKFLDSSKIFNLGWRPQIELDEGLSLTYKWFIKNFIK